MTNKERVSIIFYEDYLPTIEELRCVKCSRMICKINRAVKTIAFCDGADPAGVKEYAAGMTIMEHRCRGCSCMYKFYFEH